MTTKKTTKPNLDKRSADLLKKWKAKGQKPCPTTGAYKKLIHALLTWVMTLPDHRTPDKAEGIRHCREEVERLLDGIIKKQRYQTRKDLIGLLGRVYPLCPWTPEQALLVGFLPDALPVTPGAPLIVGTVVDTTAACRTVNGEPESYYDYAYLTKALSLTLESVEDLLAVVEQKAVYSRDISANRRLERTGQPSDTWVINAINAAHATMQKFKGVHAAIEREKAQGQS